MVAITAALRGAGGYGKTTLARALAYDEDIRRAYSDGVLWVELGEQGGSRVRPIIADLIRLLGGDPRTETPEGARIELATALADRRTLLVVDDVWERADLEPFLHCGPGTTLLITTRFDKELPDDAVRQAVDAMRDSEARVLLASGLPQDQVRSQRTELDALARKLHEWAQLLKLANGFLRDRVVQFKQPLAAAIAEAEKRLDSRGLPAFGTPAARSQEGRRKSFAAAMGLNVDLLDAHQRAQLDMLAVFPANVGIPVSIVARLWADGGEPDAFATLDRLTEFFNLSLLLDLDLDRRVIRFHDTTRHYLLYEAKKLGTLAGLHRRLVDAMEGLGTGAPGASSDEDEYYYRHLAVHLAEAGLRDRLDALLLDPGWLQDKLATTANPHLLFADYQQFGRGETQSLIRRTLQLITGICARDQRQLLPQLLGRLACADPPLRAFHARARGLLRSPAIITQRFSLMPPGVETARLEGHDSEVNALAVLPDGQLASAGGDQTIRMWDAASGAEIARLEGHDSQVIALAVLPDGRLASAGDDRTIRLWNVASGAETARLKGHDDWVMALAVLADGRLASAGDDRIIRLWNVASGAETDRLQGHTNLITAMAVLPDGRLASASMDWTVRLWDTVRSAETARLQGHDNWVAALVALPDGRLASASTDQTIRLWDARGGVETTRFEGHDGVVTALAGLPHGQLASAGGDQTIRMWDAASGAEIAQLQGHTNLIRALAMLPDGRLVSAADDRTIRLWDAAGGVETTRLEGHEDLVLVLVVLPDGRLAWSSNDGSIRLWDAASRVETARLEGHQKWVVALAVLPDGRLASAGNDRIIRLWNVASGAETARLEGHNDAIRALAVLSDGRLASASSDRTIRLWDTVSTAETARLEGHYGGVRALTVLPDGRLASGGDDRTIRLWDTPSGQELSRLEVDANVQCLLSLSNERLIAGDALGRLHWLEIVE